jgi:hypothetical protein
VIEPYVMGEYLPPPLPVVEMRSFTRFPGLSTQPCSPTVRFLKKAELPPLDGDSERHAGSGLQLQLTASELVIAQQAESVHTGTLT